MAALADGDPGTARSWFETVYDLLPGEAAIKLALAACAELLGGSTPAAGLYERVWRTDPAYVSAAFGLARTRLAQDDRDGAVAAAESVPPTSRHFVAARLAAIRARLPESDDHDLAEDYVVQAGERLTALELDAERRARSAIEVLSAAHGWLSSNTEATGSVLGYQLDDRAMRRGLERHYRTLARLERDKQRRRALVDRANAVRPVTWL